MDPDYYANSWLPKVMRLKPAEIIPHIEYGKNFLNDIALIRLQEKVDINLSTVKPVCLPWKYWRNDSPGKNLTDAKLVVTGWGDRKSVV